MDTQSVSEIQENLSWDAPDYSRLVEFIKTRLIPFMGDDQSFNGTATWSGPPTRTKRYQSVSDWETSVTASPDDLYINLSSYKTGRNLYMNLYATDNRARISITVPDAEVDQAKHLLTEMAQTLQMSIKPDRAENEVQLERLYRTDQSADQAWFTAFIAQMDAALPKGKQAHCGYKLSVSPGYDYSYNQFEEWKTNLFANWGKISQLRCALYNSSERISVDWYLDRNEFRLTAKSSDEKKVDSLIAVMEKQAGLTPVSASYVRPRLEGEQNIYFTAKSMDFAWFEKSINEILKYIGKDNYYSDFSASKMAEQPKPITWQEKQPWLDFIRDNWANVGETFCFISSEKLNFTIRCEPIHDWVFLKVQATLRSRALEITQDLEKQLDLQPIEGLSYGSIRSSGYYSIGDWSNSGFADAVKKAVDQFPKYSLRQAELIEEKGKGDRKHYSFPTFELFLERLGKDKRYIAAHLQVKGPHGAQMGVHVLNKCTRLELKSHLSPDKFPDLVELFDKELDLEKIAETKEQAEDQKKSLKDSGWVLILLPILLAILTSGVLSDSFRNAAFSKYTLQIVSPSADEGKPIVMPAQPFEVYWKLQTEHWFRKTIDLDSPANYRLFGKGSLMEHRENVHPGVKFNLPPGTYQMEITSVPSGEQHSFTFTILDPNNKPSP